ncbi:tetratricopeptide repeat protein [Muriicola sp. Z0-33]|uniref:tetratricopeptide repeat-containing sensor histidine kinase n=1 Tax=Muriicola sp. Z0-33 TaxID=2816957 RepID=UPI0022380768|nr:tetratricopeptide repeat protein [Muriicola sp. Z0-33]MCW5516398.1 tetratricopeptide repeat protein [Muriicola sp. Z0-33]
MLKNSYLPLIPLVVANYSWAFLVFLMLFVNVVGAQKNSENFKEITENLISKSPKTYNELETVLSHIQRDTSLMRYFANASLNENYSHGASYAYNKLGVSYRDYSLYDKAINLHKKALEIAETSDNTEFQIYSLTMLGAVYRLTEAIPSALDCAQKAITFAENIENPNVDIRSNLNLSLNNIGHIYRTLGEFDLAITNFKKSNAFVEELGNPLQLAMNYMAIGECLEAQAKLEEAYQNYEKSLAYNEAANSDRIHLLSNLGIGHIYVHQGKIKEALEIFEPLVALSKSLGDMKIIAAIHINIGWAHIQNNNPEKANYNLNQGLELAKKYNLLSEMEEAYSFLADLWEAQDDFKKSKEFFIQAGNVEKKISNDRNRRYVADLIALSESEKKSNQIDVLAKENEIIILRLRRNQNTLLISALLLALFTFLLYILYRQSQLKSDKKMLTLEQSMLRSQMNPHFLFNSLNSIKLYIINNEKKNAVHYLNKFSKLVRKILEASSLKEIPLAEELETVGLYMNIENIRFSNEIIFETNIDEEIDPHLVKVPSLILQPFLENALWHGLSSKEGEKKIELHVGKGKNGFITISITDNGVGRAMAEKLKESKVLKRKSVGIDITKERLANFSKDFQNNFEVEIIDLFDDNGTPSGTKVVLHVPTI